MLTQYSWRGLNYFFFNHLFLRYTILQPQFEINPSHPLIKKLNDLRTSDPQLALLVAEQLFANSMVSAGLVEDPRTMLKSMNDLLAKALEKH